MRALTASLRPSSTSILSVSPSSPCSDAQQRARYHFLTRPPLLPPQSRQPLPRSKTTEVRPLVETDTLGIRPLARDNRGFHPHQPEPARAASPRASVHHHFALHHASVLGCENEPSHSASCRLVSFPTMPASAPQPGRAPRPLENLPAIQAGEPSLAAETGRKLPSSRGPGQRSDPSTTSLHPAVRHIVAVRGTRSPTRSCSSLDLSARAAWLSPSA